MTDAKRDRFARLAPARVDKIREGLRVLSNCSNKSNYSWRPNQMQMLFDITVDATVNGIDVRTIPD